MSSQPNNDNRETLFSFEVLVEYIKIDKEKKVSDDLALGVRLLDFPTLLIYQPEQKGDKPQRKRTGSDDAEKAHQPSLRTSCGVEYVFNKGKSCLFKINLDSLHSHLSDTPLYAMVLDVKDEIPKVVGTSLISLAKLVERIRCDVNVRGVSTPSSQGEKGLVGIFNLMGEKIGLISLGYKLLSLGASLLPHISENRICNIIGARRGKDTQDNVEENTTVTKKTLPIDSGQVQSPQLDNKSDLYKNRQTDSQSNEGVFIYEANQEESVCVATQTEQRPRSKMNQSRKVNGYNFEEDGTVFCPPHLFYSSSVEKTSKNEVVDYNVLKLDLESLILEDACSEDEAPESEIEGPPPPVIDQRVRHNAKTASNQEPIGVTPNVLGESLRQLPLLNALLVELSQLNSRSHQPPLSIHPNLAWIYQPSTEPAVGLINTLPKSQTKLLRKTRQMASPRLKDIHSPKNCSTPRVGPVPERQAKNTKREAVLKSQPSSTSPRKKLAHGTTKTVLLRLKQITPGLVKRHKCMEMHLSQTSKAKGKTSNTRNKILKPTKRKNMLNQSSHLDENIETVMSSIAGDSELQETTRPKNKKHPNKSQRNSDSEALKKLIHIPGVDDKGVSNRHKNGHHSESNPTQSESDRNREKMETPGNGRLSSPKSTYSDSSRGGEEEGEYIDDFTSFEPSDGYSPDPSDVHSPGPLSSPEPALARTQTFPVCGDFCNSDSTSEGVQKRADLPVPVTAHSSPQRTLRGTHIIRPRTQASALSVSSDNDDGDWSASIQTVRSRNQMTNYHRAERSSVTKSLRSSRSQQSDSPKNSRGFSANSTSSLEPQEAKELEDELGSLDFKNKYQHISELVANKLPGYTM